MHCTAKPIQACSLLNIRPTLKKQATNGTIDELLLICCVRFQSCYVLILYFKHIHLLWILRKSVITNSPIVQLLYIDCHFHAIERNDTAWLRSVISSIGLCVLHHGVITLNGYFKRWYLHNGNVRKMSPNPDKLISQALITSA